MTQRSSTRKLCCRKETARCCNCSFQIKVCRQHSLTGLKVDKLRNHTPELPT